MRIVPSAYDVPWIVKPFALLAFAPVPLPIGRVLSPAGSLQPKTPPPRLRESVSLLPAATIFSAAGPVEPKVWFFQAPPHVPASF